jgi:hypothetical protein
MHAYEPVLCKEFPLHHVFIYLCAEKVEIVIKSFTENWDSKAPSVGTLLAYLETTA